MLPRSKNNFSLFIPPVFFLVGLVHRVPNFNVGPVHNVSKRFFWVVFFGLFGLLEEGLIYPASKAGVRVLKFYGSLFFCKRTHCFCFLCESVFALLVGEEEKKNDETDKECDRQAYKGGKEKSHGSLSLVEMISYGSSVRTVFSSISS